MFENQSQKVISWSNLRQVKKTVDSQYSSSSRKKNRTNIIAKNFVWEQLIIFIVYIFVTTKNRHKLALTHLI